MPLTRGTFTLAERLRIAVDVNVTEATRQLTAAWVRAWDQLSAEWRDAVADVAALAEDGRWPSQAQIARVSRVQQALRSTLDSLEALASNGALTITNAMGEAVDLTPDFEAQILASQLPANAAELGLVWDRFDPEALRTIVLRTTERITAATYPLSNEATQAMYEALIRGVASGQNPRTVARLMLERLEGGFNGGLARALNIARTEILDAHRAAAEASHASNAEVLGSWMWLCSLSIRTCPSCLAKNGTRYPLTEPGPIDHQQGRCSRMPVTKTWRELGIDLPEPPSIVPDAREWFDNLPQSDRLEIMGARKLELLDGGLISWDDLSSLRRSPGWRDSYGVTSLRDLESALR